MRLHTVPVSLAFAFALGCATTAALVIPKAHAATTARWEYQCVSAGMGFATGVTLENFKKLGAEGWELAAITTENHACFKRPAP